MPTTPHPSGLPSQPHQGIGARFVRRVGGAVRGVIAGGIALGSRLCQPAPNPAAPADPAGPPRPRRTRTPRRTSPATSLPATPPARARWFAGWLGPNRHAPEPDGFAWLDSSDAPFTPENLPGISPEACAFFNTPTEEIDPETLRIALAVFVMLLADRLPPELGMDRRALFATLWERLGPLAGAALPDTSPAEHPIEAPEAPEAAASNPQADAAPDAPVLPVEAPEDDAAIIRDTAGETSAGAATTAVAAASEAAPNPGPPTAPALRRALPGRNRLSRRQRWSPAGRRRARPRRPWPAGRHAPPPRRLFHAARAGPP